MEVPRRKKEEKDKIKSAFTFLSRSVDVHEWIGLRREKNDGKKREEGYVKIGSDDLEC